MIKKIICMLKGLIISTRYSVSCLDLMIISGHNFEEQEMFEDATKRYYPLKCSKCGKVDVSWTLK